MTTLVGLDVLGGVVAIRARVNEPREAWGSAARLAAPWPMIALQVGLTTMAVRARRRRARGASALLAVACLVSAVSGFLDGGFRDGRLTRRHRVLQAVLVLWTAVVGVLAAGIARRDVASLHVSGTDERRSAPRRPSGNIRGRLSACALDRHTPSGYVQAGPRRS